MTDDTSITVTALDRSLEFEDREALAEHVESFVGHAIYDPMELACIQRLAELGNGATPPDVARISRQTSLHGPDRGDAAEQRDDTPFGDRISELGEEMAAREAEHGEAVEELHDLRQRLRGADPEDQARIRDRIRAASEDVKVARRDATRARAAWNAAKRAADRWRADREARFVVGSPDDRRVVDREGLLAWLDRRS